jgi:hypothetical protein
LVIVYARLVAPEDDPLRLKLVVLDGTIKTVALTVKLYIVIVYRNRMQILKGLRVVDPFIHCVM